MKLDCPEVDLLRQVAPLLRDKVNKFKEAISGEYIDHPTERDAQQGASRELERLEKARTLAEGVMKFKKDPNVITYIRRTLAETSENTSEDIIKYQRAMIDYDRRVDEFHQCNAIARQFLSPRTRFANAWEEEERQGRVEYAEVNFLFIALLVFAALIVVATIASNHSARLLLTKFYTCFYTGATDLMVMVVKKFYKIGDVILKFKDAIICHMSDATACANKLASNHTKTEL